MAVIYENRDNRYSGGERIGAKGKKKLKILSRVVRPPSVALRAFGPHLPWYFGNSIIMEL